MTFRVTVSVPQIHVIEAESFTDAADAAVELARMGARPAYTLEPECTVEEAA